MEQRRGQAADRVAPPASSKRRGRICVAIAATSVYDLGSVIWLWILVILGLKIPTTAMVYVGWRFAKGVDAEAAQPDDDGGARRPLAEIQPRKPFPTDPRRGPHGDPPPAAPARVRTASVRGRVLRH